MVDNFGKWEDVHPGIYYRGWEIAYRLRCIFIRKSFTLSAQIEYYATKDCETVVLEAPTPDALVELIHMREGIRCE